MLSCGVRIVVNPERINILFILFNIIQVVLPMSNLSKKKKKLLLYKLKEWRCPSNLQFTPGLAVWRQTAEDQTAFWNSFSVLKRHIGREDVRMIEKHVSDPGSTVCAAWVMCVFECVHISKCRSHILSCHILAVSCPYNIHFHAWIILQGPRDKLAPCPPRCPPSVSWCICQVAAHYILNTDNSSLHNYWRLLVWGCKHKLQMLSLHSNTDPPCTGSLLAPGNGPCMSRWLIQPCTSLYYHFVSVSSATAFAPAEGMCPPPSVLV